MFNLIINRVFLMRSLVARFVKDVSGATMVEYGLLVGLIAVVCIAAVTLLGEQISDVFSLIVSDLSAI